MLLRFGDGVACIDLLVWCVLQPVMLSRLNGYIKLIFFVEENFQKLEMLFICALLLEFSVKILTKGIYFFIDNIREALYSLCLVCSFLGNQIPSYSSSKQFIAYFFTPVRSPIISDDSISDWASTWT